MSDEQKGGLFQPENFSAGGFFDDVDGSVVKAEVGTWEEVPDKCFVILHLRKDGDDDDAELRREYYTLGDLDKFAPSKDRTRPVYDEGTKLQGSVKWALLIKSLKAAGFDMSKVTDDVRFIEGLHAHWNLASINIKADSKKFSGKNKEKKEGAAGPSVLIVTKLLDTPAPKPSAGTAGGSATKATTAKAATGGQGQPAAASGADASGEAEAINVILGQLAEKGEVLRRNLPNIMFQNIKDVETRKIAMRLAGDVAWLGAADRPWAFDEGSGTLKMA